MNISFKKLFTTSHVKLYQLSGGRLGNKMRGFNVLLLETTGRKTGKKHTTPLGYFSHPEGYVIVASNSGEAGHPAWYFNLTKEPRARIQVLDRVMPVTAEVLTGNARAQTWQQVVTSSPLYADYEKRTTREIPLVLLKPCPTARF